MLVFALLCMTSLILEIHLFCLEMVHHALQVRGILWWFELIWFIFLIPLSDYFLVKFRYVVFRPFIDEILIGRIKACSHEGVTGEKLPFQLIINAIISIEFSCKKYFLFESCYYLVSMEFFDDIIIPFEYLQQPSKLYPFHFEHQFIFVIML